MLLPNTLTLYYCANVITRFLSYGHVFTRTFSNSTNIVHLITVIFLPFFSGLHRPLAFSYKGNVISASIRPKNGTTICHSYLSFGLYSYYPSDSNFIFSMLLLSELCYYPIYCVLMRATEQFCSLPKAISPTDHMDQQANSLLTF